VVDSDLRLRIRLLWMEKQLETEIIYVDIRSIIFHYLPSTPDVLTMHDCKSAGVPICDHNVRRIGFIEICSCRIALKMIKYHVTRSKIRKQMDEETLFAKTEREFIYSLYSRNSQLITQLC
jgi:hypothetical protein